MRKKNLENLKGIIYSKGIFRLGKTERRITMLDSIDNVVCIACQFRVETSLGKEKLDQCRSCHHAHFFSR